MAAVGHPIDSSLGALLSSLCFNAGFAVQALIVLAAQSGDCRASGRSELTTAPGGMSPPSVATSTPLQVLVDLDSAPLSIRSIAHAAVSEVLCPFADCARSA